MQSSVSGESPVVVETVEAARTPAGPVKILIPFNSSGYLYGMERAVIEIFDVLRPAVQPHFLLSHTMLRENLPVLAEVRRRGLEHSFFSDTSGWTVLHKPRSLRAAWDVMVALVKGNRDVLKQSLRCDAMYLSGIKYAYYAIAACIYYRMTGKRVILHFHELLTFRSKSLRGFQLLIRDFIHNTDISYRIVLQANPGLAESSNHVIPLVAEPLERVEGCDEAEQISRGRRVILFVGQVTLHKGIDLLLEAVARLSEYPDVLLVILGACPPGFQKAFDAMLADGRLTGRVAHLGYQENVWPFLSRAYVYAHPTPPSRYLESFGRSALEAMACGVPTVCFRSGAIEELVVHRETGLVCADEDASHLAEHLREFLRDQPFRELCGAKAKSRFQNLYSTRRLREAWQELLAT